jgi:lysophospholipase L1-like esterase
MFRHLSRPIAVLSLFALAACGGGGTSTPPVTPPQTGAGILTTIVGVGDSLTAGYQSQGFLGVSGVTNPVSAYPGHAVPPGQENGFWSLLYQQAKGVNAATMYDPQKSPLPLINGPGLDDQLVVAAAPLPFATTHTSACDQFNQAAYQLSTALSVVRANPAATVYDVAVPGQTAHEALYMTGPLTAPAQPPSCGFASNPNDPTAGGLQTLVATESGPFYPVLGGFAGKVAHLDQVDAAVSLRPTLATVWLGANDLLKFTFSGGNPVASDSAQQMQADITLIVQKLQNAGAKVVVANLPDVLATAQFFRGGAPASQQLCLLQNYVFCGVAQQVTAGLEAQGAPAALAQAEGQQVATQVLADIQTNYGVGANGYLTETGFFTSLQEILAQLGQGAQPSQIQIQLDPSGKGSGLGGAYVSDALAAQIQGLNDGYNAAIAAAARSTGAPLVDIHATFVQLQQQGFPLNAGCCSLVFGGGLLSLDGLHPSNTGYALVANLFIQTIDTAFGLTIVPVDPAAINATDPYQSKARKIPAS